MKEKSIRLLQILSLVLIWVFVLSVDSWILSLLLVAGRLNDALNASVAVGIVAIPLFLIIASVLTYVFVGLRRHSFSGGMIRGDHLDTHQWDRNDPGHRGGPISRKGGQHFGILLGAGLAAVVGLPAARGQDVPIPEHPLTGRLVFEQKGCITCHAIQGHGGDVGPDLGERGFSGGFLELAATMWSHAPEMLRSMRELDLPFPRLTRPEIIDLTAYLYYLRYLDEPGDLYRGRLLLQEKGCLNCHSIRGKGGRIAPAFDQLANYASPLYLAQSLWNHGPVMDEEIRKKGLARPEFGKRDIVDLSAYIRSAAAAGVRRKVYMTPGNPRKGEALVRSKGCLSCHSVNGNGASVGPDFARLRWDLSVTEIAGRMWNHGAEMAVHMKARKMGWPRFEGSEMADLIAYLFFLGFQDSPGNPEHGRQILTQKGCTSCHGTGHSDREGGAPDITRVVSLQTAIDMIRIMWNHVPTMEHRVTEGTLAWPELTREDMRDLFAYLQAPRPSETP